MISIDLTGRNALVTGGTRGIGQAISRRLAQAGANTLAVYRDDADAAQTSLDERQAFGGLHANVRADIADAEQVERLITHARSAYPTGLDFLILNAGRGIGGPVRDAKPDEWRQMFDLNLHSAVLLSRGLMPVMRRGGSIVAIGSGAGHEALPGLALYGASKAALNLFMAGLAQEAGPNGIRANVVSPGNTRNAFQRPAPAPATDVPGDMASSANALRRQGVPDDVAGAVLFLCSDLGGFISGQALRVNGGAI